MVVNNKNNNNNNTINNICRAAGQPEPAPPRVRGAVVLLVVLFRVKETGRTRVTKIRWIGDNRVFACCCLTNRQHGVGIIFALVRLFDLV